MWSGGAVPTGWALCDGNYGTPDLRDKFVIGAGNSYGTGATGGSTTIAASNLPKHGHTLSDPGHHHTFYPAAQGTNSGYVAASSNDSFLRFAVTSNTGTSTTGITVSENALILDSNGTPVSQTAYLPPYYALAYIMRTT